MNSVNNRKGLVAASPFPHFQGNNKQCENMTTSC